MPIQTRNPATGDTVKTFKAHSDAQIDVLIGKSAGAVKVLGAMDLEARAQCLRVLADLLEAEADTLGAMMTLEMGKTYISAIAEAKKCALACRYYAQTGAQHLSDDIVETGASKAYRKYLPMGPVLAVMPWNYPFWQVIRFAAPALMAGNTCILKHASNVPQCALALEDLFKRAGFPEGAFITLLIGGERVERVLRDPRVKAATLTGSELAGASVASICGELIKPTVLELGGSDPVIVMPSADIDAAVKASSESRVKNNGQACIAAKRLIIHEDVYEPFRAKLIERFQSFRVGDPMDAATDIGPLIDGPAREVLLAQVEGAVKDGAQLLTGGKAIEGPGYYFTPAILEGLPRSSEFFHQELFGPVALLFKISDIDAAIDLANDTPFGLGSVIWSADKDEQDQAIMQLEAGATFVNSMTSSDPRLPFGGIKRSGYGRELAAEGIRAFCNVKTVSIA